MTVSTGSDRYSRIENFLDKIDQVKAPTDLEEPFRSLWMRVHGDMPSLMSEEDVKISLSSGIGTEQLSDVEITSSDGPDIEGTVKGTIEVVSPKDIGPTVEMKVEDKRVTFKAAGEEDLQAMKVKEAAAGKIVNAQKITAPLKGIGGDAAKITAKVRDIALLYRDGNYDQVVNLANDIEETITGEDFKKSVLVELQKKISEYEGLGGDLTLTKGRFKELGTSLKEGKEDFLNLAQATNKLAEEAIKDIVTIEEVVLAEVKETSEIVEEKSKKEEAEPKKKAVPKKKEKPKLPGEAEEVQPEGESKKSEPKPVIKIIKKKVLVVRPREKTEEEEPREPEIQEEAGPGEEEGEDFSIDLGAEEEEDEVPKVDKIMAEKEKEDKKKEAPPPQKKEKAKDETDKDAVDQAYKKIQFVYNASVKLHEKGKDMAKIFDIMNMAEQARQKGEMKMYIGLADQLENMLISMQK
jgi:hypothetical protein